MNTKNNSMRVNNIKFWLCSLYRSKVNLSKSSRYRKRKRAATVLTSMYSSSSSGNEFNSVLIKTPFLIFHVHQIQKCMNVVHHQ